MKNIYITIALLVSFSFNSFAGNLLGSQNPAVGDVLIIAKNKGETYRHIDVPRLNMIVKRGGIASYKSIYNAKVKITEVSENEYGKTFVKLERVDGKKFFNHKKSVLAHYENAISSGELKRI